MMRTKKNALAGLALLALLALLAGCSSDPVAPHDELPALTTEETANQTAGVAVTIAEAAQRVLDPGTPMAKMLQGYPVVGEGFGGTAWIEYLAGEGVPDPSNLVTPQTAGWAHLYTLPEDPVTYTTDFEDFEDFAGTTEFYLDFTAVITQMPARSAVINGNGTMISGEYVVDFSLEDVSVTEGESYPLGSIDVSSGDHSVEIGFNGTDTAEVMIDGDYFLVNIETGDVTALPPA